MDKCPMCGYQENINMKPMTNEMSEYVIDSESKPGDDKAKVYSVINSREPYISVPENPEKRIKAVKLRRKDYIPPVEAPAKPTEPAKK